MLINFKNYILNAGNYELVINNVVTPISFNYNRDEGKMIFYNKKEIKNLFSNQNIDFLKLENNNILKKYEVNKKGIPIKNFFIILAILLLIIELLLLKIWKI